MWRGAWQRLAAIIVKEVLQLRRDRLTFAMMFGMPIMQLLLFGYAINTTPRNLPTAVLVHENNEVTRAILAAIRNTAFFAFTREAASEAEAEQMIRAGEVLGVVGESGAGKSMTGSAIMHLIPRPGRIAGGAAGERKRERHHGRALVLDQPGLDAERRGDLLDLDGAGRCRQ